MSSIFHPLLSGKDSGLELDEHGRKKMSEFQTKLVTALDFTSGALKAGLGRQVEEAMLQHGLDEDDIVHAPNLPVKRPSLPLHLNHGVAGLRWHIHTGRG